MIELSQFLAGAAFLDASPSASKQDLVEQLVRLVAERGWIPTADIPEVTQAILRREELATTAIGQGMALPHTRWARLDRPLVLLVRCHTPVDFDSLDQEPVDLFSLCLSPVPTSIFPDRNVQDRAIWLMRQYANPQVRDRLRAARTPEELIAVLDRVDQQPGCWGD